MAVIFDSDRHVILKYCHMDLNWRNQMKRPGFSWNCFAAHYQMTHPPISDQGVGDYQSVRCDCFQYVCDSIWGHRLISERNDRLVHGWMDGRTNGWMDGFPYNSIEGKTEVQGEPKISFVCSFACWSWPVPPLHPHCQLLPCNQSMAFSCPFSCSSSASATHK